MDIKFFFKAQNLLKKRYLAKSKTHLYVQKKMMEWFGGELVREKHFPSIGRIADLFWEKEGIVFEIQFSRISLDEAKKRVADYKSIGLIPVWILHTRYFGKQNPSAAEFFLQEGPLYYTSTLPGQKLCIFDRSHDFLDIPVNLTSVKKCYKPFKSQKIQAKELYFEGDFFDLWQKEALPSILAPKKRASCYWQQIRELLFAKVLQKIKADCE